MTLQTVGVIRSELRDRAGAPRQGSEGAPNAWLELEPQFSEAQVGLQDGQELIILTWLHQSRREVLQVRPRSDPARQLTGVFATRSPDRPNPIGVHCVTLHRTEGNRLLIGPIEAIDGTPVIDIKPASTC